LEVRCQGDRSSAVVYIPHSDSVGDYRTVDASPAHSRVCRSGSDYTGHHTEVEPKTRVSCNVELTPGGFSFPCSG